MEPRIVEVAVEGDHVTHYEVWSGEQKLSGPVPFVARRFAEQFLTTIEAKANHNVVVN